MFSWAKQTLATVTGTGSNYGPSAVRSVAEEAAKTPFSELTRDDLKWAALEVTCVETQTFYFYADSGHITFVQVIYSNVGGIRTTCQFNCKVIWPDHKQIWCSTPLNNNELSEDMTCFYADDCAVELSEDGTFYTIKSMNDERAIVNLKLTRTAPGFQVGTSGSTLFGTDLTKPWGSMRHAFWPRCAGEGTITTEEGTIDFKGRAFYVYALQGMKPHHAAARWNFANFQGPNYSAVMMEFTTPPSYGTVIVNVGGIAKDGEVLVAGANNSATHSQVKKDSENDWPEPSHIKYTWAGTTKDGKALEATSEGDLGERIDRVDVMAEVPGFVKTIVAVAAGTKPYIYQYHPKLSLKLKIGDEEIIEEGTIYTEATFISDINPPPSSPLAAEPPLLQRPAV